MQTSLNTIFNPASVAVVGASETPGKAAERRTRSLLEGGYSGKVFLINPKRETLFGKKAYPSLDKVPEPVDLIMVVIRHVLSLMLLFRVHRKMQKVL